MSGCQYMDNEGVGSYYCRILGDYVDYDHFSRYCYQSLAYHDCPLWNHQDDKSRLHGHGGAAKQEGDCYLTTACTVARNLSDDCLELKTLRAFRDNYLTNRTGGSHDIAEYYYIAPKIVEKINQCADADQIWNSLYNSLILPCVALIKDGKFEETYRLYKKTAEDLRDKYLR